MCKVAKDLRWMMKHSAIGIQFDGNGTLDLLVHSSGSRLGIFNEGGWTLSALEQISRDLRLSQQCCWGSQCLHLQCQANPEDSFWMFDPEDERNEILSQVRNYIGSDNVKSQKTWICATNTTVKWLLCFSVHCSTPVSYSLFWCAQCLCYRSTICHICIYNSVPFSLKMEEVNNSKVLHEQMRELVFHVYQYFKNKVWALEGDATHQVVAHNVAWCQKHAASHFQPQRELQVRHHHRYSHHRLSLSL